MDAEIHIHKGFHSRNQHVAKSSYMLAFTFGKRGLPPSTKHFVE